MTDRLVAPGYEAVRDAFEALIAADGAGAALAAVVDGRPVLDLWRGTIDEDGRPWQADTACVVFSGTKGVVATAALVLAERGVLDLDAPVARYWPAFAQAGKEQVTVGDVLAHTAGLPGVIEPVAVADLAEPERIFDLLAAQAPIVPVGAPSYHARTYGWLVDAIVRRRDGRHVAAIVEEELAAPLGLDFRIGADAAVVARTARMRLAPAYELSAFAGNEEPDPRLQMVYGNPAISVLDWTSPMVLGAEIPAANGVGTARALARLYGALARGGEIDGVRVLGEATVLLGRRERSYGIDPLSGRLLRFGAGYELAGTPSRLGPPADAFGHTGAGGSTHGAWPGLATGFSLVVSEMRTEDRDERAPRILEALHAAVTR